MHLYTNWMLIEQDLIASLCAYVKVWSVRKISDKNQQLLKCDKKNLWLVWELTSWISLHFFNEFLRIWLLKIITFLEIQNSHFGLLDSESKQD